MMETLNNSNQSFEILPVTRGGIRCAMIDVGTNSVKLLIADVFQGQVIPLLEQSEQTRLGMGFYENHRLQTQAIAKTASVITHFSQIARAWQTQSLEVIATSASRDAHNQHELLGAIHDSSGLQMRIIAGEQEAELAFQGVVTDARFCGHPVLITDCGGGSCQFIYGEKDRCLFKSSYRLGAVRLHEKFPISDPPKPAEYQQVKEWVMDFLRQQVEPDLRLAAYKNHPGPCWVGVGGTASVLASIWAKQPRFERDIIESTVVDRSTMEHLVERLWGVDLEMRRKIIGVPSNRADILLFGSIIHLGIMEQFGLSQMQVSTRGFRFGAIMEMARKSGGISSTYKRE